MDQIKLDLKAMSESQADHAAFVLFVQEIIFLIRTHAPDFCSVDDFFYQLSREYSPPSQDPQLQVAGMISYGLKLSEGDQKVGHTLFFTLLNNFKVALMNDKLQRERDAVCKGLENRGIMRFVLGQMLPAIIGGSFSNTCLYPMMDVYADALRYFLDYDTVAFELKEEDLPYLIETIRAIEVGLSTTLRKLPSLVEANSVATLHIARQAITIFSLFWPTLWTISLTASTLLVWTETLELVRRVCELLIAWSSGTLTIADDGSAQHRSAPPRLANLRLQDQQISIFTANIIADVEKNWLWAEERLSICAPGRATSGVTSISMANPVPNGVKLPSWEMKDLLFDLKERIRDCLCWWGRVSGGDEIHNDSERKLHWSSVVF